MAKKPAVKSKTIGPQLAAAVFCERTIADKEDDAISVIRVIDTLTIRLGADTPPDFPSPEHRLPVQVAGLISFRSGDSPGDHLLRLVLESPSGKRKTVVENTLTFSAGAQGGFALRFNSVIQIASGGLFWLHVFLDEKRVTRMPLLIRVERSEPAVPTTKPKTNAP